MVRLKLIYALKKEYLMFSDYILIIFHNKYIRN